MKNHFNNRNVTYKGVTCEEYVNGESYNVDITPFSDDVVGGEKTPDNRYMVYKTVNNIFLEGNNPSGYRVYSTIQDVAKDFQKNG